MKDLAEYRAISFDLDGTLTESREPMTEAMAVLLCKLAYVKKVVIISGGSFEEFKEELSRFFVQKEIQAFRNIILMPTNGSQKFLYDTDNASWGQVEGEVLFSKEHKERIISVLTEVITSRDFDIPTTGNGVQIEDRQTQISFSALGIHTPIEEKKLWDNDQVKRKKIVAHITPLLPEFDIFIAGTTTIDILPKGVTKGTMLKRLLQQEALEKTDMLFIGDALYEGGNDYEVEKEGFATIKTSGPVETTEIIKKILDQ